MTSAHNLCSERIKTNTGNIFFLISAQKHKLLPVVFIGIALKINRIYDGVEAETRKSQACFQII